MLKEEIEQVESLTYLGIKFDYELSWETHAKQLSKHISRARGAIRKIEPMVNPLFLKNLFQISSKLSFIRDVFKQSTKLFSSTNNKKTRTKKIGYVRTKIWRTIPPTLKDNSH